MKALAVMLIATFLATSAFAQARIFLSKAEVDKLATGKKWIHLRPHDQRKILWGIRSDGNLWGSGFVGPNRDRELGRSMIKDSCA
jgi:hypothetical protein